MILGLQVFFAAVLGFLQKWIDWRWKTSKGTRAAKTPGVPGIVRLIKAVGPVTIPVLAVLAAAVTEYVDMKVSEPHPEVIVEKFAREMTLRIRCDKLLSSVAVDIPILGRVTRIHDDNSSTSALIITKRIDGKDSEYAQNNVVITATDVSPDRFLFFRILYEPIPDSIMQNARSLSLNGGRYVIGADVFPTISGVAVPPAPSYPAFIIDHATKNADQWELTYAWHHGSDRILRLKRYGIGDGVEVPPLPVIVRNMEIAKRVETPEEVKQEYEAGPQRRIFP